MQTSLFLRRVAVIAAACMFGLDAAADQTAADPYAQVKTERHEMVEGLVRTMTAQIESGKGSGVELAEAYRHRAIAYNYLLDYRAALADFDHAIELNQLDAGYYEDRAISYLKLREFHKANTDLEMALGLDSKRASARREKGRMAAYQGEFQQASNEFLRALSGTSGEATVYGAIWLHIALNRAGRGTQSPLKAITKPLDAQTWPWPVVQMLLGKTTPQDAIDAATKVPSEDALLRLCEANFYAGEQYLIQGDRERARAAFEAAKATQITDFVEYDWAVRELEQLDVH
ncbi:MAG: hypothetical protein ABI612_23645 [Betaproteobacteria bacterium]